MGLNLAIDKNLLEIVIDHDQKIEGIFQRMLVPKRLSDGELRLNFFSRFLEKLTTFPESGRQVIPARLVEALADEPEGRHLVEREVGQDDDKDVDGQRLDCEGLRNCGYLEQKNI